MTYVANAFPTTQPRSFDHDEFDVSGRDGGRDRALGRSDAIGSYPTPAELVSRMAGLILIFLWIAAAADCLVDALGM